MSARTVKKTWFVSYKTEDRSHHERMTRTFQSEDDAKHFAMQMLIAQKYPVAGTLNPHQPKQIISSFRVASWATSDQATLIAAHAFDGQ
jgi:hypothetical protein